MAKVTLATVSPMKGYTAENLTAEDFEAVERTARAIGDKTLSRLANPATIVNLPRVSRVERHVESIVVHDLMRQVTDGTGCTLLRADGSASAGLA